MKTHMRRDELLLAGIVLGALVTLAVCETAKPAGASIPLPGGTAAPGEPRRAPDAHVGTGALPLGGRRAKADGPTAGIRLLRASALSGGLGRSSRSVWPRRAEAPEHFSRPRWSARECPDHLVSVALELKQLLEVSRG